MAYCQRKAGNAGCLLDCIPLLFLHLSELDCGQAFGGSVWPDFEPETPTQISADLFAPLAGSRQSLGLVKTAIDDRQSSLMGSETVKG